MRQVGRGNAAAAIAYSPRPITEMVGRANAFEAAVQNVGAALGNADVKMLDAIVNQRVGAFDRTDMTSFAEAGKSLTTGGTFFQRNEATNETLPIGTADGGTERGDNA